MFLLMLGSMLYSPFLKSRLKAYGYPVVFSLAYCLGEIVRVIAFKVDSSPLIGIIILPPFVLLFTFIFRSIKNIFSRIRSKVNK